MRVSSRPCVLLPTERVGGRAHTKDMADINARILGTGRAYPEGVLTNADLVRMVETSDEWITTRTGIRQRHRAAEGEYTSQFAVAASRLAIERARIDPMEIDLLICATVTPDQILPSTGCLVQAELGANNAAAFDLAAACSGFLYGLTDRKSTRLNSSHANISYAVFCLKKKKSRLTSRSGA